MAPSVAVVLVGWCLAQLCFNAFFAALVAVLPDQVPAIQRGQVSGVLGVCLPIASVAGTFLVQLFTGNQIAMFAVPCAMGGFFVLLFVVTLKDRRLAVVDKPAWSVRELISTFYVNPRKSPDFAWVFASRFMFVLAYAFLTTYQAYYLLDKIGSAEAAVPRQIFIGTLVQSVVLVARHSSRGGSPTGPGAARSSSSPRRSCTGWRCSWSPSLATSTASSSEWRSADSASACTWPSILRSVVDVLPDPDSSAKDLGSSQHRRRAAQFHRTGDRAGDPGGRWRQLHRAVRGRRGLCHHRGGRDLAGQAESDEQPASTTSCAAACRWRRAVDAGGDELLAVGRGTDLGGHGWSIAGHQAPPADAPRAAWYARPRLGERLARATESALTLVSAPAGFGKTTLLAEWLTTAGATESR